MTMSPHPTPGANNVLLITIKAIIGCLLGGLFAFLATKRPARKISHHGLAELETRLPVMCSAPFLGPSPHPGSGPSYHAIATDCFVMTTIMRAVVGFAWSIFVGEWIAQEGARLPVGIYGLLTVPLRVYGKRMRIVTSGLLPKVEEVNIVGDVGRWMWLNSGQVS